MLAEMSLMPDSHVSQSISADRYLFSSSESFEFDNDSWETLTSSSTSSSDSKSLCQRCRRADFKKIFHPDSTKNWTFSANFVDIGTKRSTYSNFKQIFSSRRTFPPVGGPWDFRDCLYERQCPFCRLLVQIMQHIYGLKRGHDLLTLTDGPMKKTPQLRLVKIELIPDNTVFRDSIGKEIKATFKKRSGRLTSYFPKDVEPYHIRPLSTSSDGEPRNGYARRPSRNLDADLIRKWTQICTSRHGSKCEELKIRTELIDIRLINVEDRCIQLIPNGQNPRYISLSCPWGKIPQPRLSTSNLESWSRPGALFTDASSP